MCPRRQRHRRPPKEIVIELELARCLEGGYVAALRIDAGHHMGNHAVLPRRVEPLQDDEDRPLVLGIELVLQGAETLGTLSEQRLGLVDVDFGVSPGSMSAKRNSLPLGMR